MSDSEDNNPPQPDPKDYDDFVVDENNYADSVAKKSNYMSGSGVFKNTGSVELN